MMEKLNAIIVDPEDLSRNQLKTLTQAEEMFGTVLSTPSMPHALKLLEKVKECRLIFLSYDFSEEDRSSFMELARSHPAAKNIAVIQLAAKIDERAFYTEASNYLTGAEATLFEPYSIENLLSATRFALDLKSEERAAQVRSAMRRILSDVFSQIDRVASCFAENVPITSTFEKLEESAFPLRNLNPRLEEMYFEVLQDMLESSAPPVMIRPGAIYTSPNLSRRNDKKLGEFIRSLRRQSI